MSEEGSGFTALYMHTWLDQGLHIMDPFQLQVYYEVSFFLNKKKR